MDELKVIEKDLVPVYETDTDEKVVYGSELHAVLGVKSKFADWIKKRIDDCEATENVDYHSFSKILEKGGRPQTEYIIKLDTAKEMAMLERNQKGKEVRKYFIAVEKKYKTIRQQIPMTVPEQIRLLAQGNVELREEINTVRAEVGNVKSEVESFKESIPLLPAECDTISNAVRRKGVEILGGKESPAYKDNHIRRRVYLDIYNELYRQFAISSYKSLSRSQCKEALDIISGYTAPIALKADIAECIANPLTSHKGASSVIAKNIMRMMVEKEMSQKDLADKLAVSTGLVSSWCHGTKTPRIENLVAIADALGVSWNDIVCEA